MTDEEIAVELNGHEHEIKSLKHRMVKQEEESKVLMELVMSVRELAANMERMITEQGRQKDRLEKLEQEPANKWKDSTKAIFNAILGSIGTLLGAGLIYLLTIVR